MRRLRGSLALLAVFILAPGVRAETLPVTIQGFVGTPADSSSRREFMTGFKDEFAAGELRCESSTGDAWGPTDARRSPFVLVDAAGSDHAWALDITIGVPPEVRITRPKLHEDDKEAPRARRSDLRTSRGLTIVTTAIPPAVGGAGPTPEPVRLAVYFAGARRVVVPTAKLPGGGYSYPWEDAGRVVARAALESLLRAHGDLSASERADLAPATRVEATP